MICSYKAPVQRFLRKTSLIPTPPLDSQGSRWRVGQVQAQHTERLMQDEVQWRSTTVRGLVRWEHRQLCLSHGRLDGSQVDSMQHHFKAGGKPAAAGTRFRW
jgi:hypothetical protein